MDIRYEAPAIEDLGSIADNTFQTPGEGTKSSPTPRIEMDKYGEYSHPFAS